MNAQSTTRHDFRVFNGTEHLPHATDRRLLRPGYTSDVDGLSKTQYTPVATLQCRHAILVLT